MADRDKLYMGIDIGSVSLNIAIIDEKVSLLASMYERTKGQPVPVLLEALNRLAGDFPRVSGVLEAAEEVLPEEDKKTRATVLAHGIREGNQPSHNIRDGVSTVGDRQCLLDGSY